MLTNEPQLAQRLDLIAYSDLTTNFDLARTAALIVDASDILAFGSDYANTCIANARAQAATLAEWKAAVHESPEGGYSLSHDVALRAAEYGGGTNASCRLDRANPLTSGIGLPLPELSGDYNGLRMGT